MCKYPSKREKSEEKLKPTVNYINSLILIEIPWEQLLRLLATNVKNCCEDSTDVVGTGPAGCLGHAGCPSPGHLNNYPKLSQAFDASLHPPHTAQREGKQAPSRLLIYKTMIHRIFFSFHHSVFCLSCLRQCRFKQLPFSEYQLATKIFPTLLSRLLWMCNLAKRLKQWTNSSFQSCIIKMFRTRDLALSSRKADYRPVENIRILIPMNECNTIFL